MNINDIARKLGMAKSTVSKALNNRSDVGEKTKIRVRQLVEELDYAPNHFAQALNFRKSRIIGIIMHDELHEEFFGQVVWIITVELQQHGYAAVFASSQKSAMQEKAIIRDHVNRFMDGFILVPCAETDVQYINDIISRGYKLVTVDNHVEGINAPFIGTDFARGTYLATKHLLDSGHRQIGHLAGPRWADSTKEQAKGYREAYRDTGIDFRKSLTINCEYDESDAKKKFMRLKEQNPKMTAIHCAGLAMTNGALSGIRDLGLSVPRDISIIDYGSTSFISSINQKSAEIGKTASKVLIDLINGKDVPSKSIIAPELVIRNSSRRLRLKSNRRTKDI